MEITQEYLKKLFDYKEGNLIWKKRRSGIQIGRIAGCLDSIHGYLRIKVDQRLYNAHHLIWCWHYGTLPKHDIDHINRIRHDNRIENLRLATFENLTDEAANGQNRSIMKNNTSGYNGVTWIGSRQKWEVRIALKKKRIFLGRFKEYEDACAAYDHAKTEYHKFHSVPCQAKKIEISA